MPRKLLVVLLMLLSFSDCKSYDMGSGLQTRNSGTVSQEQMNFIAGADTFIDFTLQVDVNDSLAPSPSGFFKTYVYTIPPGATTTGPEPYGVFTSCCRKAVGQIKDEEKPQVIGSKSAPCLTLYPNPAGSEVNLDWTGENAVYEIRDLLGKSIKERTVLEKATKINTASFPNGLYQIRVYHKDGLLTDRLLIVK